MAADAASALCEGLGLPRDAAWRVVAKFYGLRADDVDPRAVVAVVRPPSAAWYRRGASTERPTARPTCVRGVEMDGDGEDEGDK